MCVCSYMMYMHTHTHFFPLEPSCLCKKQVLAKNERYLQETSSCKKRALARSKLLQKTSSCKIPAPTAKIKR